MQLSDPKVPLLDDKAEDFTQFKQKPIPLPKKRVVTNIIDTENWPCVETVDFKWDNILIDRFLNDNHREVERNLIRQFIYSIDNKIINKKKLLYPKDFVVCMQYLCNLWRTTFKISIPSNNFSEAGLNKYKKFLISYILNLKSDKWLVAKNLGEGLVELKKNWDCYNLIINFEFELLKERNEKTNQTVRNQVDELMTWPLIEEIESFCKLNDATIMDFARNNKYNILVASRDDRYQLAWLLKMFYEKMAISKDNALSIFNRLLHNNKTANYLSRPNMRADDTGRNSWDPQTLLNRIKLKTSGTWNWNIVHWNLIAVLSQKEVSDLMAWNPDALLCEKIEAVCELWRYKAWDSEKVWSTFVPYSRPSEFLITWENDYIYRVALWVNSELN